MLIHKRALKATLPAISDTDTRYTLGSIQINPATGTTTATNGHVLIRTTIPACAEEDYPIVAGLPADAHAPAAPFLVPGRSAETLIAGTGSGKRHAIPVLEYVQFVQNGGPVVAASTNLEAATVIPLPADGRYPNCDQVIPSANTLGDPIIFGLPVLEVLLKAAKAFATDAAGAKQHGLAFRFARQSPGDHACTVTITDGQGGELLAVLMPMRA